MIGKGKHIIKIIIPAIVGMFFLFACGNSNEEIAAFQEKEKMPQLISTDIVIEYSDSAQLKARIKAPLLKEYGPPENYTVMPHGVDVYFYNNIGKVISTMHADSAIIRRNSDLMESYRNVKVVNENGEKLETQELFWKHTAQKEKRELYTHAFVTITKDDEVFFGNGLRATESFSKYRITKPQGSMYIEADSQP